MVFLFHVYYSAFFFFLPSSKWRKISMSIHIISRFRLEMFVCLLFNFTLLFLSLPLYNLFILLFYFFFFFFFFFTTSFSLLTHLSLSLFTLLISFLFTISLHLTLVCLSLFHHIMLPFTYKYISIFLLNFCKTDTNSTTLCLVKVKYV